MIAQPASISRPLATLTRGATGVVEEIRLDASERGHLDSIGLHTNAPVRVCSTGLGCVVVAAGEDRCRIGLERGLAERIMIAPTRD